MIIFGVTKFYQYVHGRKFTLRTDHKPLEHIFEVNQEIPKMAANRLQRWAINPLIGQIVNCWTVSLVTGTEYQQKF